MMNIVIMGRSSSIHYCSDLYVGGFKKNFIFGRKNEKLGNFFLFRNVPEQRATAPFFRVESGMGQGSPKMCRVENINVWDKTSKNMNI